MKPGKARNDENKKKEQPGPKQQHQKKLGDRNPHGTRKQAQAKTNIREQHFCRLFFFVVFVRVAHRRRRRRSEDRTTPCQNAKVTHLNRFQEIVRYYYYY